MVYPYVLPHLCSLFLKNSIILHCKINPYEQSEIPKTTVGAGRTGAAQKTSHRKRHNTSQIRQGHLASETGNLRLEQRFIE